MNRQHLAEVENHLTRSNAPKGVGARHGRRQKLALHGIGSRGESLLAGNHLGSQGLCGAHYCDARHGRGIALLAVPKVDRQEA